MKKHYYIPFFILLFLSTFSIAQPVKVEVRQVEGEFSLYRNNEPYYIKGVGGSKHVDQLLYLGGNSIRTWGIDEADEALEVAEHHGYLLVAFSLGHSIFLEFLC